MTENVTLLRPETAMPGSGSGGGSTLPAHLLDAVRHRVRVLTSLMIVAFAFDPLVHAGCPAAPHATHSPAWSRYPPLHCGAQRPLAVSPA